MGHISGADPGFQVRGGGGALKKIAGVFRVIRPCISASQSPPIF